MNAKIILLLCSLCTLFLLSACLSNDTPLPTRVPTAAPLPLPATSTPLAPEIESEAPQAVNVIDPAVNATAEIDAILQEIDLEACQKIIDTQAELDALQEQGKDVTELATAVAELAIELEYCEPLLVATPGN